jgi:hypothetical protein
VSEAVSQFGAANFESDYFSLRRAEHIADAEAPVLGPEAECRGPFFVLKIKKKNPIQGPLKLVWDTFLGVRSTPLVSIRRFADRLKIVVT